MIIGKQTNFLGGDAIRSWESSLPPPPNSPLSKPHHNLPPPSFIPALFTGTILSAGRYATNPTLCTLSLSPLNAVSATPIPGFTERVTAVKVSAEVAKQLSGYGKESDRHVFGLHCTDVVTTAVEGMEYSEVLKGGRGGSVPPEDVAVVFVQTSKLKGQSSDNAVEFGQGKSMPRSDTAELEEELGVYEEGGASGAWTPRSEPRREPLREPRSELRMSALGMSKVGMSKVGMSALKSSGRTGASPSKNTAGTNNASKSLFGASRASYGRSSARGYASATWAGSSSKRLTIREKDELERSRKNEQAKKQRSVDVFFSKGREAAGEAVALAVEEKKEDLEDQEDEEATGPTTATPAAATEETLSCEDFFRLTFKT